MRQTVSCVVSMGRRRGTEMTKADCARGGKEGRGRTGEGEEGTRDGRGQGIAMRKTNCAEEGKGGCRGGKAAWGSYQGQTPAPSPGRASPRINMK